MQRLTSLFKAWSGRDPESVTLLPLSGSARKYYRMTVDGRSAIGVIGTNLAENEAFLTIDAQMVSKGIRAPQVYDEDLHVGAVNGELYKITNAADLRQERSHSLNVSADLCFHLGDIEGDLLMEAFFTRINDAFVNELLFDDTGSGYRHYERRNSDGAEVKGFNIRCLKLLSGMVSKNWCLKRFLPYSSRA